MGKIDQLMHGRNEGLAMALRIVQQGGVEALEKEIEFRRLIGFSPAMTKDECIALERHLRHEHALATIPLTLLTLHDEFGFGAKRCDRFSKRYQMKIDGLVDCDSGVTYKDYLAAVLEEIGYEVNYK